MAEPIHRPTRVLLADPHALFQEALRALLPSDFEVVGGAHEVDTAVREAVRLKPDLVVSELRLPGGNELELARRVLARTPSTRIVVLTSNEDEMVASDALAAGAAGYLLKTEGGDEFVAALRAVRQGDRVLSPRLARRRREGRNTRGRGASTHPRLSPRAAEVVRRLAQGYSMKQVGMLLGITTRTVAFHKYRAMELLGIRSSAGLVRYAVDSGLVGRLARRSASPTAGEALTPDPAS